MTTLLKIRRLLESHDLGAALFPKVGEVVQANGLTVCTGTIDRLRIARSIGRRR